LVNTHFDFLEPTICLFEPIFYSVFLTIPFMSVFCSIRPIITRPEKVRRESIEISSATAFLGIPFDHTTFNQFI